MAVFILLKLEGRLTYDNIKKKKLDHKVDFIIQHIKCLFSYITFRFGVHEHQWQFHCDITKGARTSQSEKGLNTPLFGYDMITYKPCSPCCETTQKAKMKTEHKKFIKPFFFF